jgi:HAMP domain-containing protein
MQAKQRSVRLVVRILLAIVIAGLIPLIVTAVSALNGYRAASNRALIATTTVLDDASLAALQIRTKETARELGHFLDERAADARTAAHLPADPAALAGFSTAATGQLWYETGSRAAPTEQRQEFPLYREIVAIDPTGRVIAHIVNDQVQADPGDPALTASYLATAESLDTNAISVSHLSRRYTPRPSGDASSPPGADYLGFDGVYRFIAARRTARGAFDGAVMLAFDARHVIEQVIHILPTQGGEATVWPNYDSGNYAYLLDDQGWTIAHPRLWTVRGDDANGQPVPAVSGDMPSTERDRHPFNAQLGGWADPNLPIIFGKGRAGQSGFVTTVNQQGARKATTYAPVPFSEGDYRSDGVFAVLAIGVNTVEFHRSATTVAAQVEAERQRLVLEFGLVALGALAVLAIIGVAVSRVLVRPLSQLTAAARQLEQGEFDEEQLASIRGRRFADEVTLLANVFAEMGRQVVHRERQLRIKIDELHIQVDSRRRQQEVDEITETDYFRNLTNTATRLRSRTHREPTEGGDPT